MTKGPRTAKPLSDRYEAVRKATKSLSVPLATEDFVVQSMPDTSPTKWHLAHTTWFFETFVLEKAIPGYRPFHSKYRFLFNSYYNAVGEQFSRPDRGLLSRPTVEEVFEYRAHVDALMQDLLRQGVGEELEPVVVVGVHHEQQHQELMLMDIKHAFSLNPMLPAYLSFNREEEWDEPAMNWVGFEEGIRNLGHAGPGFAFDNEYPRHEALLPEFELGSRPVTNREYLEFIADGGYEKPELWLSDGWARVNRDEWNAPLYWEKRDDEWWSFTLGGMRRVRPSEPVCHVSYFEADAYARWAGARLPSEQEWEYAAEDALLEGNFVEDGRYHPRTCGTGAGLKQIFGDVWEWTMSPYMPYPGYRQMEGAIGEYNGKFMSGQMVLRGGSCVTPAGHIRPTYRNFFRPADRWTFAGFRLARN